MGKNVHNESFKNMEEKKKKRGKSVAADGFDPSTSGLWAQHAPTAPLCSPAQRRVKLASILRVAPKGIKMSGEIFSFTYSLGRLFQ